MTTVSGIHRNLLSVGGAEVVEKPNQNAKDVYVKKMTPKRDSLGRPYYTEAIHPRKKGGRVLKKTKRRR